MILGAKSALFFFLNSGTTDHGLQISSHKIVYNLSLRSSSLERGEEEEYLLEKTLNKGSED